MGGCGTFVILETFSSSPFPRTVATHARKIPDLSPPKIVSHSRSSHTAAKTRRRFSPLQEKVRLWRKCCMEVEADALLPLIAPFSPPGEVQTGIHPWELLSVGSLSDLVPERALLVLKSVPLDAVRKNPSSLLSTARK